MKWRQEHSPIGSAFLLIKLYRPTAMLLLGLALVTLAAHFQFQRIAAGNLFLLPLAFDAPPSRIELLDAKRSAEVYHAPALLVIAIGSLLIYYLWRQHRASEAHESIATGWLVLLIVGAVADLVTTLWFFYFRGIDHEVHPAIRLFGYAYGRTMGPLLGKTLQAAGVILLAMRIPRLGEWILLVAASLYLAAAFYNALLMG